jgi:AraC family transcriptional regulator, regulatory protein of adaptative response / methylated-DNA-[protein]-cysteine methyltransferase
MLVTEDDMTILSIEQTRATTVGGSTPMSMNVDYTRIERAIRHLDSVAPAQPTLREIATQVGLSEFHFQRLFTRWAGVSPKRFLQLLTLEYAKQVLDQSRPVLDAAFESGLSGGSRLHDLFVSLEAVTPGEYRARGAGLRISVGFHDTPFGECLLAVTERGVCGLTFHDGDRDKAIDELAARWPNADIADRLQDTAPVAARIFAALDGARTRSASKSLSLLVKGTNFQVNVWRALLRVPSGSLVAYEDVARAIGEPGAVRAVGTALGRNPIAMLIPCHRVVRNTGALGGYRWGPDRKRAMLSWEFARAS